MNNNKSEEQSNEKWENIETNIELPNNYEFETTNYQQKQNKLAANCKTILDDIYNSILDNEAMPNNSSCFNCNNTAILKCIDCGLKIFYCKNCFNH